MIPWIRLAIRKMLSPHLGYQLHSAKKKSLLNDSSRESTKKVRDQDLGGLGSILFGGRPLGHPWHRHKIIHSPARRKRRWTMHFPNLFVCGVRRCEAAHLGSHSADIRCRVSKVCYETHRIFWNMTTTNGTVFRETSGVKMQRFQTLFQVAEHHTNCNNHQTSASKCRNIQKHQTNIWVLEIQQDTPDNPEIFMM